LVLKLRRALRRLEERRSWREVADRPAGKAWSEMLGRLNAADAERRLAAAESALNRLR
jgi:hypothetical protein